MKLIFLFVVIISFFYPSPLIAGYLRIIPVSEIFKFIDLRPYISLYPIDHDLPADSVYHQIKSGNIKEGKPGINQYIWVYFRIFNDLETEKELILDINNVHLNYYELYSIDPDSLILKKIASGGTKFPYSARKNDNRHFIENIAAEPGKESYFLMKVDDRERETVLSLRLLDIDHLDQLESKENLFYNLYFGGLFFIGIFSLVLGYILRFTVFYSYGLYALVMAFFMFINLGFGYQFLYPDLPWLQRFLDVILIIPLLFSFVFFASCYFKLRENNERLYIIVKSFYALLASALIFWLITRASLDIHYYILLNYLFISGAYLLLAVMAITSYRKNRTRSVLFLMAFSVLAISGSIFALIDAGKIPQEWFFTNPLLLGSIIEFGIFAVALVVEVKYINDTKNRLLSANIKQQKQVLNAYVEGAEKERTRLSGELHDNIGSRLALLKNQIADKVNPDDEIISDVGALYQSVRSLSHELSPGDFNVIGFEEYLRIYLQKINDSSDLKVKYFSKDIPRLQVNQSGQLFRVIQEAAQNTLKHSGASTFEVQLLGHPSELVMTIDDDGEGFNQDEDLSGNTRGIFNMRIRVESLGGTFELSSAKGKGSHIIITIPLTGSQEVIQSKNL